MFFALLSLVLGLDTNNCVKIKCDGTISPNCMTITASTVSVNSCQTHKKSRLLTEIKAKKSFAELLVNKTNGQIERSTHKNKEHQGLLSEKESLNSCWWYKQSFESGLLHSTLELSRKNLHRHQFLNTNTAL